jgi:hypothetical protein
MPFEHPNPETGLTPAELAYAEAYLLLFNQTRAYMKAFNATYQQAVSSVAQWHRKPQITAYITNRLTENRIKSDEVIARIKEHAEASFEDFVDIVDDPATGKKSIELNLAKAAERGKLHLIKKITTAKRGGRVASIELVDSQAALDKIARAEKLYGEIQVEKPSESIGALGQLVKEMRKKQEEDDAE